MFSVLCSGGDLYYVLSTAATHRVVCVLFVYCVLLLSKTFIKIKQLFIHSLGTFGQIKLRREDYPRTNTATTYSHALVHTVE